MALKFTYIGQSTFLIEVDGVNIVIDPYLAPHNPVATVTAEEVPADYILISHGHGDHIADAVPLAKRTGALVITNADIAKWLDKQGVQNVHAMHIGGAHTFPFGRVKLTVALHGSRLPDGSVGGNPVGFLIHFNDGHDVYFAGDTGLTYDMKLIADAGGVDLALLPIGDNFTMGPEDAIRAAQFVNAKHVIPMHYNTFPLIEQDGEAFAATLHDIAEIDSTVMKPGDQTVFE